MHVDQAVANENAKRVADEAWNARLDKVVNREDKNENMLDRLVDRLASPLVFCCSVVDLQIRCVI